MDVFMLNQKALALGHIDYVSTKNLIKQSKYIVMCYHKIIIS